MLWFFLSAGFAVAPLFVNYLMLREDTSFTSVNLYDRGELFLIAAVLCADSLGRLLRLKARRGQLASLFATICLIAAVYVLFASSIEFGLVARSLRAGTSLTWMQARDSLREFCGAVAVGLGTIMFESVED